METKQTFTQIRNFFFSLADGAGVLANQYEDSECSLTLMAEGSRFVEVDVRIRHGEVIEVKVNWSAWGSVGLDRFDVAMAAMNKAKSILQHVECLLEGGLQSV